MKSILREFLIIIIVAYLLMSTCAFLFGMLGHMPTPSPCLNHYNAEFVFPSYRWGCWLTELKK